MVPAREDLLSPATRCLFTLGTSRNTRALSHPIAYAGSMLAGCNSLASSVNLCLQWSKACQLPCSTQPSLVPQRTAPGGTASQDFTSFFFLQQQHSPKHWERHLTLFPIGAHCCNTYPPVQPSPREQLLGQSVLGSLQPGCQCRARARPSQ